MSIYTAHDSLFGTYERVFILECVNEALRELKDDQSEGAAVLQINGGSI